MLRRYTGDDLTFVTKKTARHCAYKKSSRHVFMYGSIAHLRAALCKCRDDVGHTKDVLLPSSSSMTYGKLFKYGALLMQ